MLLIEGIAVIIDKSGLRLGDWMARTMVVDTRAWITFAMKMAEETQEPEHDPQRGTPESESPEDPYVVLGLTHFDSDETIKSRHKALVMQYHPDRLHSFGPELQSLAEKKIKAINSAYQKIAHERNIV